MKKPTDGTSTSKKDQLGHGKMKSGIFFEGVLYIHTLTEPRRRIEEFVCKDGHGVMNVHFFSLSAESFPTDFLRVSYTCSGNNSVYDGGCTHTHLSHAHFSVAQFVCAHPHIFMRVTYTHGSSVCKKVFACVSLISPSNLLPSHDSLILGRSLRDHSCQRLH